MPERIDTPAGTVAARVPKIAGHEGEPCCPQRRARGWRSSRTAVLTVAEMHVKGASTREAEAVMREFGIEAGPSA